MGFTPFQLAYSSEEALPIQCQIPSLKIVVELLPNTSTREECLLYLNQLDETRRESKLALEAHKHQVKTQYDKRSSLSITKREFLFCSMIKNMTS